MPYTEEDIRAQHIDPTLERSGWDGTRVRREVAFTAGRINIHGKTISRGEKKRADYILYYKNNLPLALVEAKDDTHTVGDGMQQ